MPRHLGSYRVVKRLGHGGLGAVHRAVDDTHHRGVVIKTLDASRGMSPGDRERLLADAFIAAGVSHPAIARLYDITDVDGHTALVFEAVDGETLDARLARGPVLAAEALRIAIALADGLAHAHSHGLAHLDLKPRNIRLDAESMPKILDLGLASWTRGGKVRKAAAAHPGARARQWAGTIEYLSPEQALGDRGDYRSDLWSFGAIFFELLTRARPFTGVRSMDVLVRILQAPIPRVSDRWPALPPAYSEVVARCLSRSLATRYQSAEELQADLHQLRRLPVPNDFAPSPMRLRIPHAVVRRGIVAGLALTGLALAAGWWVVTR
jgi:serine/threonine protein kinase